MRFATAIVCGYGVGAAFAASQEGDYRMAFLMLCIAVLACYFRAMHAGESRVMP